MNEINPQVQSNKIRISNFEILRLVCMLLIIFSHYFVHGLTIDEIAVSTSTLNTIILNFFCVFGNVAVLVFMIISGYFGSSSKFRFTKFLLLLFEYIFYSLTFYFLIQMVFLKNPFDFKSFIHAFVPFYGSSAPNWFISSYLIFTFLLHS